MNQLTKQTIALLLLAAATCAVEADDAKPQQSQKLKTQIAAELDYLLYLPEGYEKKKSWPLMLFLHGAGERGDNLERVKVHGPPKLIEAGKHFPFIVVSPQCPRDQWWEPLVLGALLDEIEDKYNVNKDRIYVTGLSMGGFGTWSMAGRFPHRFAAVAPICGGGETHWVKRFPHLPVWAFHGAKDEVVRLERSQKMVDELKKRRGIVKLTVYAEAGHDSWSETYDNPELYKWLLSHSRSPLEISPKKSGDQVDIRSDDKATYVWIKSSFGIGKTTLTRKEMKWPQKMIVRLRLSGLESFIVSNSEVKLTMSIGSHGDHQQLSHVWRDNKEGPQLTEESGFWTKIEIVGRDGKPRKKIPVGDGFFEVALPKAFFQDNPESIDLHWVDFFRR